MAGTIFANTKIPLTKWFRIIWDVVRKKNGASALSLASELNLNYDTVWNILQKLRRAMVTPTRQLLKGTVEVDETFYGGFSEGHPGRSSEGKILIAGAVELNDKGALGRIRLKIIESGKGQVLLEFLRESVAGGSHVITDGWRGYSRVGSSGYTHEVQSDHKKEDVLPHIHIIFSLLKRWILGTHQGAISREHLEYYLDEFVFRFNRRTAKNRTLLFHRVIENAVRLQPITWAQINKHSQEYHRKSDQ
jgi:transposase-like protein